MIEPIPAMLLHAYTNAEANRPGKEVIADCLQKGGANRAHNQKAGAEERVCETSQAFETFKEMQVPTRIL